MGIPRSEPPVHRAARTVALAAALFCMLGVPAIAGAAPSTIGIWYGEGQPDDPKVLQLIEFRANGTFVAEFRKYDGCKVLYRQRESGTWTVDGTRKRMITQRIDGQPADFDDSYTIDRLTQTEQRVRHEPDGFAFDMKRVEKFEFPTCFYGV